MAKKRRLYDLDDNEDRTAAYLYLWKTGLPVPVARELQDANLTEMVRLLKEHLSATWSVLSGIPANAARDDLAEAVSRTIRLLEAGAKIAHLVLVDEQGQPTRKGWKG